MSKCTTMLHCAYIPFLLFFRIIFKIMLGLHMLVNRFPLHKKVYTYIILYVQYSDFNKKLLPLLFICKESTHI